MKKLLYIILILLLASPVFGAYSNINCDDADATTWCILTSDTTFDGDTDCGGACDSSDTIIIEGGARANLLLRDLDGSGSYITITNEDITPDSRVVINENAGDGYGILSIYNCKYIDLTGNNDADLTYGIVVEGDGDGSRTGGIWVYGESDHVKIGYIEVDFSGSSETYGNGIFVQDGGLSASWTWDTFEIHHNYIHDTRYHGMYLGENQPSIDDDPWSKNFSIHDNILEDLGGNGFVYKGVATGGTELIYNNTVDNTGLVTAAGDEWKAGIRWRPYSSATVSIYNNTVFNTPGPGIIGWESQTTIYDNILAGNGTGTDGGIWRHGILIDKVGANIPDNVTIYDNIIIQPIGYGIYNNDSATAGVTLSRNLIGDAGLGEWDETNSGDTVESGSPNDNTYHADVATFNFNTWSDDSNYSNDVFRGRNLDPENSEANVPLDKIITWTLFEDVTGVDLYFEDATPPTVKVVDNADQESYDPTLVESTTYYYKLVYYNPQSTSDTGAIYSFSVLGGGPITITPPGALTIVPDAGGAITITY